MKKLLLIFLLLPILSFSQGNFFGTYHFSSTIDPCTLNVGDSYGGGIIGYYFVSGNAGYVSGECHGIIVSTADLGSSVPWSVTGTTTGAIGDHIGDGALNTALIVSDQGAGYYAAKLCDDYYSETFFDWFLPSLGELVAIYPAISWSGVSRWCSTEYSPTYAKYTANGYAYYNNPKTSLYSVRAVRNF